MKAQDHPDYAEEQQHLDQAVAHIEAELARPFRSGGVDDRADVALVLADKRYKANLQEARQQAYFARVDEPSGAAGRHTLYIGKHYIHHLDIYSWADTRAGDLFYKATRNLLLKRAYELKYTTLDAIRDQYVDPSLSDRLVAEQFTDSLLHKMLQASRSGYLHDIVATIQEQQYNIIQAPKDALLLVQGVAGSGKSSIALHRMAYLLYNHRAALKNILVLGPSRIFLDYIGNILPSLGEHTVPHRTFSAWLLEKLGKSVKHHSQEHLLERLLAPGIGDFDKLALHRNAFNKGSLKMAALLERYLELIQQRLFESREPLVCHIRLRQRRNVAGDPLTIEIDTERSTAAILSHLHNLRDLPLNHRKAELERRLIEELTSEVLKEARERLRAHSISPFTYDEKEISRNIRERVTRQVHAYFSMWTAQNPSIAYHHLFRAPALLNKAGKSIFSRQDLEMLTHNRPKAGAPFEYADLAPLLYLKILFDGTTSRRPNSPAARLYDHIVVDEAQDISPLYLKILERYSHASSITLLGDLAQGIYMENAVTSWDNLLAASPSTNIRKEAILQSYRSTREIIDYANDMLRRIGTDERRFAEPIGRIGSKPHTPLFYSRATFLAELLKIIKRERDAGHSSIALICKTAGDCRRLANELGATSLSDYQLVDAPDTTYAGGLAIIPSYLTKGLEFDTVVIVDADATNYPADELSARLLYVALTRASHALYVCAIATVSPLLRDGTHRLTLQLAFPVNAPSIPPARARPTSIRHLAARRRPSREGSYDTTHVE